jgi:hypothetical protein
MAVAVRFGFLFIGALAVGCSNQVDPTPTGGLDGQMGNSGTGGGTTGGGSMGSGTADACSTAANWQASKVSFDESESPKHFARALNTLITAQSAPAIAVTNYMAPGCVWMVSFSAPQGTADGALHSATYTKMFRHPAALWTAAPQPTGWIRVIDTTQKTVWIPIADLTGSASFAGTQCSSISQGEASATIPASAASLAITTSEGATTLGDLLGKRTSNDGWQVRLTFSAELAK